MKNWAGKVVVVTGGSAGLGAAIAAAFLDRGADVISISRSVPESLSEPDSISSSQQPSSGVQHYAADVTRDRDVKEVVQRIVEQHGRIDAWVNNVGKSTRVAFDSASIEEYRDLMELNFFAAVRCSMAVLPHLQQSSGSLVQIGSLAAKTGWQNVAPYATSKHALAGFAHQLRIEGPANVHNLFVCPGPIRRSDAQQRYAEQAESQSLDPAAASPGGGVKLKGLDPKRLADKIVSACEKRKLELVLPRKTRIVFAISQLSPRLGDWLLRKFAK